MIDITHIDRHYLHAQEKTDVGLSAAACMIQAEADEGREALPHMCRVSRKPRASRAPGQQDEQSSQSIRLDCHMRPRLLRSRGLRICVLRARFQVLPPV